MRSAGLAVCVTVKQYILKASKARMHIGRVNSSAKLRHSCGGRAELGDGNGGYN